MPRVDLPPGTPVRLRVPAREVALALSPPDDVSISNRIAGRVEQVLPGPDAPASADVEVRVRVGAGTVLSAMVTRESVERLALAPGLRCWCLIKSVALHADALALARGRALRTGGDAGPAQA